MIRQVVKYERAGVRLTHTILCLYIQPAVYDTWQRAGRAKQHEPT